MSIKRRAQSDDLVPRRPRSKVLVAGMSILAAAVLMTSLSPLLSMMDTGTPVSIPADPRALLAEAERTLASKPNDPASLLAAANAYYDAREFPKASDTYAKLLAKTPENADARVDYGTSLLYQGKAAEALEQYHRALADEPAHVNAHINAGVAYRAVGDKAKAKAHWEKALSMAGEPSLQEKLRSMLQNL